MLLVIAAIGCITLFLAATIAITAADIKRVLAYSTVSQLGFMMLALGLGGWLAGLFHLITHAFFKSLLFLCSGSVIHAVHTNDMRADGRPAEEDADHRLHDAHRLPGDCRRRRSVPGRLQRLPLEGLDRRAGAEPLASQLGRRVRLGCSSSCPCCGAALTAFYMFRLWYMTFAGEPRDHHRYDHAHESPQVMTGPLVVLAVFAVCAGWHFPSWAPGVLANFGIAHLLEQARPVGTLATSQRRVVARICTMPTEHLAHAGEIKVPAGIAAITAALLGILLATVVYLWRIDQRRSRSPRSCGRSTSFSWHKWWFDELYDFLFVRPALAIGAFVAVVLDRGLIDGIIDSLACDRPRHRGDRVGRRRPLHHRQRRRHGRREDLGPGPRRCGRCRPAACGST